MGAWGYGWHANDGAFEFVDEVIRVCRKRIFKFMDKKSRSVEDYEKVRAACVVVLRLQDVASKPDIQDVVTCLTHIMEDHSFIGLWDNPSAYRKAVNKELTEAVNVLKKKMKQESEHKERLRR